MRLLLALFFALSAASARAENPAAVAPPPALSRSNWDKAVHHARGLHDAVKAQIERMDWAEDAPKAMTQGSGRARRGPKTSQLRRAPKPQGVVPAVVTTADLKTFGIAEGLKDAPAAKPADAGLLSIDALGVHALPSLDQTLAPMGPEAVAPQAPDPRCADPRARADRRRCPSSPR